MYTNLWQIKYVKSAAQEYYRIKFTQATGWPYINCLKFSATKTVAGVLESIILGHKGTRWNLNYNAS